MPNKPLCKKLKSRTCWAWVEKKTGNLSGVSDAALRRALKDCHENEYVARVRVVLESEYKKALVKGDGLTNDTRT